MIHHVCTPEGDAREKAGLHTEKKFSEENRIGRKIINLAKQLRRQADACVERRDATGVQWRVLHYIVAGRDEDICQKNIEEEFNIRGSTVNGILNLMEKNGMIRRESVAGDARLKRIVPTEKALELKEQVAKDIDGIESRLAGGISDADLETFHSVLARMSRNMSD